MENQGTICRLCLTKNHKNFNVIDENIKSCLDVLLPEANLNISEEPMMCTNCEIILQKCYNFKSTCLATIEYMVAFVNEDVAKLNMRDIYLSVKGNEDVECTTGDFNVCCFCMGLLKNDHFVSLEQEDDSQEIMLEKCLPELDISIIKKPVVCAPCHEYLEEYFRFMTNCRNVEETIKKYGESVGTNSKDQIELMNVLEFSLENMLNENVDTLNVIKKENQQCEQRQTWIKCKNENITDSTDQKFKSENTFMGKGFKKFETFKVEERFCEDTEITKTEVDNKRGITKIEDPKFDTINTILYTEEGHRIKIEGKEEDETEVKPNTEEFMEVDDKKFAPCENEDVEMKADQHNINGSQNNGILPSDKPHILTNREVSNVKRFQCEVCSYQTKRKSDLNIHLLLHKNPSEVPLHKCELCSFESKNKNYLRKHLLVHRDPSEIMMYKCEHCSYQAKHSSNIRRHLLVHKDPSETKMFVCKFCPYQSKNKYYLRRHLLVHKDPSETTMYKCESCPFQTKHKNSLCVHNITHKNPSEVIMYQCDSCLYQSSRKDILKIHLLVHESSSKSKMYKCESCSFQSKKSNDLRRHSQMHQDTSDIPMFKCESCSYQSEKKTNLKKHSLVHKDPSEVTMYKCQLCTFQTKRKQALSTHSITHKNPSEIIMYQCDSCAFQTKYEKSLRHHVLTHKAPSTGKS